MKGLHRLLGTMPLPMPQFSIGLWSLRGGKTEIKTRRLEWLGHVIRMDNERLPKLILNSKPEERQKLRWLDDSETDLRALGVKRWRIKALDRTEWSAILRAAKAKLQGP